LAEPKETVHGGDIYRNPSVTDYSVNSNPLGVPEAVRKSVQESADRIMYYPDVRCDRLRESISDFERIEKEKILCGNGAAELFFAVVMAVRPKKALVTAPAFSEYERALGTVGAEVQYYRLKEEQDFRIQEDILEQITEDTDMIFLCNPNNPTGHAVPREQILQIAERCEETAARLILDECFCDLLDHPEAYSVVPEAEHFPGLFILRAFTKTYAMAGLRLGYGICADRGLLRRLSAGRQPWSISVPAQEAGCAALRESVYLNEARELLKAGRVYLTRELRRMGFLVYDSDINFILFFYRQEPRPLYLYEACLQRDCSNFTGLACGYYRICVSGQKENQILVHTLEQILEETGK